LADKENDGHPTDESVAAIFDAIKEQNPQLAKQKMKDHFKELYQYCYSN